MIRTQIVLLVLAASTAALADQVVMKNGDRVTGAIVKKEAATLTIKTVHFGTVTLPWDQVDSVKADTPLTVVLPNDKSVEGTIVSSGDKLIVTEKSTTETVTPKDIVALRNADEQRVYMRYLKPRLLDLWLVSGNIGIAGTSGNATTRTFAIPVNLVRATKNDKTTAYFNFIKASSSVNGVSSDTAQAVRGGWAYNRNLRPKIFATIFNDYEFDRFQRLDLRMVLGGGLGWHAWKRERGFLDLVGGFDFSRQQYGACAPKLGQCTAVPADVANRAYTTSNAEVYYGDDFGFKVGKKVSFAQTYRMFNNLSDTGNYRQNFDVAVSASLAKYFTWNAALSDRYVSNPAPGRKSNDFLYSTGFGFTFTK